MSHETHVIPNPAGGWDVVEPGASERESNHPTQADAQRRAREVLRRHGGGELVIHGRDGRIRESDTVVRDRALTRH